MYECESWNIKKAEWQRIDAFKLWFWRGFLAFPSTVWRSNQTILKEISLGCSLEGLMCLETWCEEVTHLERLWFWERLKAGGEGDKREWYCWMTSPTQWSSMKLLTIWAIYRLRNYRLYGLYIDYRLRGLRNYRL